MPIKQPDGNKVPPNCCEVPHVADGVCKNCGYNWNERDDYVEL